MVFAQGLCYYKLFCTFVIGGVIGDIVETIFCYVKYRKWMSRSSFIYGHMSIVWGFAFLIATVIAYYMNDLNILVLYAIGIVVGSVYEYLCSVLAENFIGVKFWDYSKMPYNIEGRINLKYCLYWGMAMVLWIKIIFPILETGIEKIPIAQGTILCNLTGMLLLADGLLSIMAIKRYTERRNGYYYESNIRSYFDRVYPDARIEKIYPHITICEEPPKVNGGI